MKLPPLKSVIAFEVVARLASINKAADELNLTPSAISHQIANLETSIGRKLFERGPRGMMLTPVGERYQRSLAGVLALIRAATDDARTGEGVDALRVHSSPSFASLWLMPRLPRFMAANPDIQIKLSASHTESDFARQDIDLDIRYGAVRWADLSVETLFTEQMVPLASPTLLDALELKHPEDLVGRDLIYSAVNLVQWPQWFAANGLPMSPGRYVLSFDRAAHVIDAAVYGLGIALESDRLAEEQIARELLRPVFPDRKGIPVHAHHLVYPPSHGTRPRVARFIAWIRQEAARPARHRSTLRGAA